MNFRLFIFFIMLFQIAVGQTNMFTQSDADLSQHFVNSDLLKESAVSDRYSELTRSEGFLVNDVTIMGSVLTKKLHRSGKVIFNCQAGDYLNELKSKLLEAYPAVDKLVHIYVTEDPTLNAFATVNNNVYVNIGLLARVENEAQLAFILCHEIMHIVDAHIINETLSMNREAKVFNKSNIGIDDNFLQLRRHEISREHETEADIDGLTLFLKQSYDALECVSAMELLERANDYTVDFELEKELLMLSQSSDLDKMLMDFKQRKNQTTKDTDESKESLLTHPLIDDRIQNLSEKLKQIEGSKNDGVQFLVSKDIFLKVHSDANDRINEIFAENLDFLSLFLNASARYKIFKDYSKENLDHLGYSLQGLLIDKFNEVNIGDARSTNKADSVLSYFYSSASKEAFAKWAYQAIDTLVSKHSDQGNLNRYYQTITQSIINEELKDSVGIFGEDDAIVNHSKSTTLNGLDIEKISFEITPFSDMSIFKMSKFNESQKHQEISAGKVAIVGMNMIHIRKSEPLTFNYMIDLPKTENIEQRADQVCENMVEDYKGKVISLIPSSSNYSEEEYVQYDALNQWLTERLYFNNENYVSIHDDAIKRIIEEKGIHYVMSSVNIGIKSFSIKNFLAVYFSPFVMPIYLPQLIAHIGVSSTRKFQLTLIFDVRTGGLAFWDKRTYLEPSSQSQIQITYNDVLNTFFNE